MEANFFTIGMYDEVAFRPRGFHPLSIVRWSTHLFLVLINKVKALWQRTYRPDDVVRSFTKLTFQNVRRLKKNQLSKLKTLQLETSSKQPTTAGLHLLKMVASCFEVREGRKEDLFRGKVQFRARDTNKELLIINDFLDELSPNQLSFLYRLGTNQVRTQICDFLVSQLNVCEEAERAKKTEAIVSMLKTVCKTAEALKCGSVCSQKELTKMLPFFSWQQCVDLFSNFAVLEGFYKAEIVTISDHLKKYAEEITKDMTQRFSATQDLPGILEAHEWWYVLPYGDKGPEAEEIRATVQLFAEPWLKKAKTLLFQAKDSIDDLDQGTRRRIKDLILPNCSCEEFAAKQFPLEIDFFPHLPTEDFEKAMSKRSDKHLVNDVQLFNIYNYSEDHAYIAMTALKLILNRLTKEFDQTEFERLKKNAPNINFEDALKCPESFVKLQTQIADFQRQYKK